MAETFIALERASRSGRAWLEAAIWPAFVAGFTGLLCLGVAHGHMELTYAALPALGYAGTYTFANVLLTFAGTALMML